MTTYVDLDAEFKPFMSVTRGVDTSDDTLLRWALEAAEATINDTWRRNYTVASGTPTALTFAARGGQWLFVDDFVSLTSVATTSGTVDSTYYTAARPRTRGGSYDAIMHRYSWPDTCGFPDITVTADWGWTAIPKTVKYACMVLAKDVAANQQVSFGIAAFTEYAGVRAKANPQLEILLGTIPIGIG